MDNITITDIPTILNQLYSSKSTKNSITRKLIENIVINNKYAATMQISERAYNDRVYRGKSLRLYISHLYINRENRIVGRRNKIILSSFKSRQRSCNFELLSRNDSPIYFFPDKHTLCIIVIPLTCFVSRVSETSSMPETACIEITFVGKNAKTYIRNIKTMLDERKDEDAQNYIRIRRAVKDNRGDFNMISTSIKQKSMNDVIIHDYNRGTILSNLNKFTVSSTIYR